MNPTPRVRTGRIGGFTLVELLTVIAVIGILTAILIPSATAARVSVRRAQTKVLFGQWAAAMELFRQEYGFYPAIDGGNGRIDAAIFAGALTGRALDGSPVTDASQLAGNSRRVAFYAIGESELNNGRTALADAFGNSQVAVLIDTNGDGRITNADGHVVAVHSPDGTAFTPSVEDLDLTIGVRAGVIFYSAGNGTPASNLIYSWK